jgi:hypothetical protein
MPSPAAERERQREADDGNRNETVYFLRSGNGGSKAYHVDRECRYLDGSKKAERSVIEKRRGDVLDTTRRAPCAFCTVENEHTADPADGGSGKSPAAQFADLIEADQRRRES